MSFDLLASEEVLLESLEVALLESLEVALLESLEVVLLVSPETVSELVFAAELSVEELVGALGDLTAIFER